MRSEFNIKLTQPQNAVHRLSDLFRTQSNNALLAINDDYLRGHFGYIPIVEGSFEMTILHFNTLASIFTVKCLPEFETKFLKIIVRGNTVQIESLTQETTLTFIPQNSQLALGLVCEKKWLKAMVHDTILKQLVRKYSDPQPLSLELQRKINTLTIQFSPLSQLTKIHFCGLGWALLEAMLSNLNPEDKHVDAYRIEKILLIFEENLFGFPPNLKDIASQINISNSKLKQLFREKFGLSAYAYYKKMKMAKGLELLRTGRYNVNQVAVKLGYTSAIKFVMAFKSIYNKTPGEYIHVKKEPIN